MLTSSLKQQQTITIGDTFFVSDGKILSPCLIVKNKSSMSCVAILIKGCEVKIGDEIVHQYNPG